MSDRLAQSLAIRAALHDVFDGLDRLIGELRRSGYAIQALTLDAAGSPAAAALTVLVPGDTDPAVLAARLARHPAVAAASVQAQTEG